MRATELIKMLQKTVDETYDYEVTTMTAPLEEPHFPDNIEIKSFMDEDGLWSGPYIVIL